MPDLRAWASGKSRGVGRPLQQGNAVANPEALCFSMALLIVYQRIPRISPSRSMKKKVSDNVTRVGKKTNRSAIPKLGTAACREYFLAYSQINSFFHFVLHTVSHIDKAAEVAHTALVNTEHDPVKKQELEESWVKRKGAVDALRDQRQFFIEIIVVRHVENYLNYLSSLLFEIFTQRPETLRSSDRIAVEEVLRHSTVDAIVKAVAERKVETLSYSSFQDLAVFFKERFSLTLASTKNESTIVHAIELRNISVHNRCIVNRRFISRTGDEKTPVGSRKDLFVNYLDELVPLLKSLVQQLDRSARLHLKLKATRFQPRTKKT